MNTSLMTDFFISHGFVKDSDVDYYREANGFLNAVNFQKKTTGDVFFINLGVHPIFRNDVGMKLSKKEIDCYVRTRISTEKDFSLDLLAFPDRVSLVLDEIERKAWPFFDFFSSLDEVFSPLSVESVERDEIPTEFNGVTKVRLVSMCMNYHLYKGNVVLARNFAGYGLSIAGMAVVFKKEFKQVLSNTSEKM